MNSLKERVSRKFNVSISEVGNAELWQRADILIAMVGKNKAYLEHKKDNIGLFIEGEILGKCEITSLNYDYLKV